MTKRKLQTVSMEELRAVVGLRPIGQIDLKRRGLCGNMRGEFSETVALRAATGLVHQIPWLKAARAATDQEEKDGKDIVLGTDRGEVYVQVKSSRDAAKRFERWIRTPRSKKGWLCGKCIVIAAGPTITLEKIMLEMLIALVQLRTERT